jgi:glycosyltransferase involved in cell wall biosynthesis
VVAFDNAGVPEAVQDGKTGFLVPMYAAKPFADAIERLLKNKDLRRQMSRAAQAHIRQAHDLNKNYQKMENVLQAIIKTPDIKDSPQRHQEHKD